MRTTYGNNQGEYHIESEHPGDRLGYISFKHDSQNFIISDLGFIQLLIMHANKDKRFLECIRKVTAELGV